MAKNTTVTQPQQNVHARNVANNAIVRMQQRVAALLELRKSKHAARIAARQQGAFAAQVHQLAAQFGVPEHQVAAMLGLNARNARANSATVSPSRAAVVVDGGALRPCAAVHALCAQHPDMTRAEMVQLCVDNGINKATAATQVGVFRTKAAQAAKEAAEQAAKQEAVH